MILSGVLQDRIGEHAPIFAFLSTQTPGRNKSQPKHVRHYDYSSSKLNSFVAELDTAICHLTPSINFYEFTECFSRTLDKHCKLEVPKTTKRTPKLNPWITDGIILSVERKHELCKDWSDTVTNRNPGGDPLLYKIFSDYRRTLKSIIKAAKRSHYCNEIYKNIENSKKTWQVINELRGKKKKQTKPPFIINNERIMNRRIIANGFNSWFVSIAPKLNEALDNSHGIPILPIKTFYDFLDPRTEKSIRLEDFSPGESLSSPMILICLTYFAKSQHLLLCKTNQTSLFQFVQNQTNHGPIGSLQRIAPDISPLDPDVPVCYLHTNSALHRIGLLCRSNGRRLAGWSQLGQHHPY